MERTPEEKKIEIEIGLLEAEASLCRHFAVTCPRHAPALNLRAQQAETGAHNAKLFLTGRLMIREVELEREIEESRR